MTNTSSDVTSSSGPTSSNRLTAHLGLTGATALAITVVVGSGALVLPGVAYRQAGDQALLAWCAAAVITIPLLVVFARLGARHPGAGGVAGFVQAAFGRAPAAAVEVLVMGAFALGIPGIALTGGNYVGHALGWSPRVAPLTAACLVVAAGAVVVGGGRISGRVQTLLALTLTIGLLVAALLALSMPSRSLALHPPTGTTGLLDLTATIGTVFFAFTGWEMVSFTTEEYRNPRRDFPRVLALSFLIVTLMYMLLAIGLQVQLSATDPRLSRAPVAAMVEQAAGAAAGQVVSVLGIVLIVANLIGAVWGASRLVMASARSGLLPRRLAHIDQRSATPRWAVAACLAVFLLILAAAAADLLSLDTLLGLAGRNFFLVYLFSAVAYARTSTGGARVFGILVTVGLTTVTVGFGPESWGYALALLAAGLLTHRMRS